jgi:flagellar biosynthesis protein FlhF
MQTKAYFASSVPAALEVARRELGPEAMLVGSRPSPPHVRQFGRLEVTFAWTPAKVSGAPEGWSLLPIPRSGARAAFPAARSSDVSDLEDIRRQLCALRSAVGEVLPARSSGGVTERLAAGLREAGIDPEISREMATTAGEKSGDPESNVFDAMVQRIAVSPFTPLKHGEHRTIAFIGPPGRGKTTTLIKVAVAKALTKRIPVRVYTAGSHGVGGSEQMAHYCSILGCPFQGFESLESLELALEGESWKGLSLIDTPGLGPAEQDELMAFTRFFARREECEKHLVLRAESRYADMLSVIERFAGLHPARLLFTGTDETDDWSAMVNVLIRASIPVTFEGTGRAIPEDLADADAVKLAGAVLTLRAFGAAPLARQAAA